MFLTCSRVWRRDRYIQVDQDFTWPGLRCLEGVDLGRNLAGFIVNASLVVRGYFGHLNQTTSRLGFVEGSRCG